MTTADPGCETRRQLSTLGQQLPRLAEALRGLNDVNIIAIGSSSTVGERANSDNSYPSNLALALSARFPGPRIRMHNVGVNGQEAPDEAARFKKDVLAFRPALVIWQVGTNAAWKDYFLDDVGAAILRGSITFLAQRRTSS